MEPTQFDLFLGKVIYEFIYNFVPYVGGWELGKFIWRGLARRIGAA